MGANVVAVLPMECGSADVRTSGQPYVNLLFLFLGAVLIRTPAVEGPMYTLSTTGTTSVMTTGTEKKEAEVRLTFAVPKSEGNLKSSTVFDNEGSKESGRRDAARREVPAIK
jgi:hypothetical protein